MTCLANAYEYCKFKTTFDECPGLLSNLEAKEIPFSAARLPPVEQQHLGALRFSTNRSWLGGWDELTSEMPDQQGGMLRLFTTKASQNSLQQLVSMPALDCVADPEAYTCDADRADLDTWLYDMWFQANKTDRTYDAFFSWASGFSFPEGKHEAALDFQRWDIRGG